MKVDSIGWWIALSRVLFCHEGVLMNGVSCIAIFFLFVGYTFAQLPIWSGIAFLGFGYGQLPTWSGIAHWSVLFLQGMDMDSYLRDLEAEKGSFLQSHQTFVSRVLGFSASQRGLIVNGKVREIRKVHCLT